MVYDVYLLYGRYGGSSTKDRRDYSKRRESTKGGLTQSS